MGIIKRTSILSASVLALVAIANPVFAVATANAHAETAADARQAVEQRVADKKEAAQTRLADAKLKACQNREKAITNIMSRLADRGQKQLNLFSTIADKVEAFYSAKGKTVSNYDALVADLTRKKLV